MDRSDTRLRVLVVEDCRDTAETLRYLMGVWGYQVCLATNGSAAVALAPAFRPDVVLIDIGLPGANGFEVARRMTCIPGLEPPVLVAATGWDGSTIRRDAREVGFDHFLSKPFDLGLLRSILSGARSTVPIEN